MKRVRGALLGALAGLLFGVFVSLDLFLFGILALDHAVVGIVPIVGLVGGVALGAVSPLGRRRTPRQPNVVPPEAAAEAVAGDAPAPVPPGAEAEPTASSGSRDGPPPPPEHDDDR